MSHFEFHFSREMRNRFRTGDLTRGWAARFPHLFTAADLRIALNQPQYHFYEWLSAVRLFSDFGLYSLVESYHWKSHQESYRRFTELTSPAIVELLSWGKGKSPRTQGPDLLTWDPESQEWFFVEVKGPRDRISAAQADLFRSLEELSGKAVRIAWCIELPTS